MTNSIKIQNTTDLYSLNMELMGKRIRISTTTYDSNIRGKVDDPQNLDDTTIIYIDHQTVLKILGFYTQNLIKMVEKPKVGCNLITCKHNENISCTKDQINIDAETLNRYYEDPGCDDFDRDEEKAKPYIVWE